MFFSPSFILSKTVRVSCLALLCNNKNDPCGYPNKSLFISVTDWTTQGPFLCLAGLWPHESKFWNILMKTLTREVSEQPFRLGSQTDPLVYIVGSCWTVRAHGAPRILKGRQRNAQMQLFVLRPLIRILRASCCCCRVESSRPLWVSVCACVCVCGLRAICLANETGHT